MSTYDDLKTGDKLRTLFGNSPDRTYHVRGKVDDRLILRTWSWGKRRWEYLVEGREWFTVFGPRLRITRRKQGETK